MRIGLLRRRDDTGTVGLRVKPGDIVGDGPIEQGDALRQVADQPTQHVGVILVERRAIEADLAGKRPPDAGQRPGQCRLACTRGADDPQRLPRFQPEADLAQQRHLFTRGGDAERLDLDQGLRAGQGRAGRGWGHA